MSNKPASRGIPNSLNYVNNYQDGVQMLSRIFSLIHNYITITFTVNINYHFLSKLKKTPTWLWNQLRIYSNIIL